MISDESRLGGFAFGVVSVRSFLGPNEVRYWSRVFTDRAKSMNPETRHEFEKMS